jgi:alkylation response protein AidB-like acyl-CoA dehydrogenase
VIELGRGPRTDPIADRIALLFEEYREEAAERWDAEGRTPAKLFQRLGELGAFTSRWPLGRDGPGLIDTAAALARECALTSVGAVICLGAHTDGFLPALWGCDYGRSVADESLAGRVIGCVAITEPSGGSDVTRCATRAERTARGWRLTGQKQFVSNVSTADEMFVFARTGSDRAASAFTVFIVPTQAKGVTATPRRLAGARASGTCLVGLDGVRLGDDRRVGDVGSGFGEVMRFLRLERLWVVVGAAAIAELCVEVAVAFAARRRSGDGVLADRQAIAHRLVDMHAEARAARLVADDVVRSARARRLTSAASAEAKLFVSRTAWRVADEAMQILAGNGYTDQTPFMRVWRDARVGRIGGGADEVLRELASRALRPGRLAEHPVVSATGKAARGVPEAGGGGSR